MLLLAVVVAGDGPGTDVHIFADGRIADVGQVRHLRALPHRGLLDLHVGAGLRALAQMRRRTQVRARTACGAVVDLRFYGHRLVHDAAAAHRRVGQARVGADDAVLADAGGAHERDVGQQLHVLRDGHVRTDPYQLGVDHGHAGRHMRTVDATLGQLRGLGQLDARVHAQALGRVVAGQCQHGTASVATDLQHVGEVELALRVIVAHLLERVEQRPRIEAVEPGIALADGRLLGRGVLLLHDARHRSLLVAHDAPVAERVVQLHREHHHGRVVLLAHGRKARDGIGRDQRAVARQHHQRAVEIG